MLFFNLIAKCTTANLPVYENAVDVNSLTPEVLRLDHIQMDTLLHDGTYANTYRCSFKGMACAIKQIKGKHIFFMLYILSPIINTLSMHRTIM